MKSVSLLECYFLLHVSVIYDHHQSFVNSKTHLHLLLDCVLNSLLECYFLLHVSVIFDHHQSFVNSKTHLHWLLDCMLK
jgi:hypothetical protein